MKKEKYTPVYPFNYQYNNDNDLLNNWERWDIFDKNKKLLCTTESLANAEFIINALTIAWGGIPVPKGA